MTESLDFVNKATDPLGDRAEANGIQSLSYPEQVALITLWATGIIDNGGFRYFYEGANNTEQVADAFDTLGFHDAAQACRETIAFFPPEVFKRGYEACTKWLDAHYTNDELFHLFDKQNFIVWELNDSSHNSLDNVLAEYIRTHRSEFQALE
jgi:hypothetical protein